SSQLRELIGPPTHALPDSLDGPNGSKTSPEDWHQFDQQFIGHTEAAITTRFGPQTHRWEGMYGNPPVHYRMKYPDAVTAIYERPSGALYLAFCWEKDKLVCFSANWVPKGVVLD
ncbi:MAG TPA: hypothetical protein VLM40_21005, partial [Gemmata sp.]|nr:hypothetical protein [Gemmata sp.]